MSDDVNDNSRGKKAGLKVRLIKLASNLRIKGGLSESDNRPGELPAQAIKEADQVIKDLCETCPETVGEHLKSLTALWHEMEKLPESPRRQELAQHMFTIAHEIKDVTAMCGYELNAYFAESLRDYIGETHLQVEAVRVIIQAHLDAMNTVHKQGLKEDGGPVAEELKKMVKVAVDKYK